MRLPIAMPIPRRTRAAAAQVRIRLEPAGCRVIARMLTSRPGTSVDRSTEVLEEPDDRWCRADEEGCDSRDHRSLAAERRVVIVAGVRRERPDGRRDQQAAEGGEERPEREPGDERLERRAA